MEAELTEAGKNWIKEHYPQKIAWEYNPDKPFKLHSVAACANIKDKGLGI